MPVGGAAPRKTPRVQVKEEDTSDEDMPLSMSQAPDSDSDSDVPMSSQQAMEVNGEDDEDEEDEEDAPLAGSKRKRTRQISSDIEGGGEQRWTTLIHKGPKFPEPYTPLPRDVMLKYDGKPVPLPPESEEVAMFYAVKLESQHASNPIFNRNFFEDFCGYLKKYPPKDGTKIQKFEKLDFRDMHNYWMSLKNAEAERKKSMAPSMRKAELAERKAIDNEYKLCLVDGLEQRAGNVTVEPPGLFLGRGAHPKAGRVKTRIMPEQITINHSADHPPPKPPKGHSWGEVVERKDVTWLALWRENINGGFKYVFLDASSTFKTESDREKFEKARRLDTCVKQVRTDVLKNLKSKDVLTKMIATIVWLIDNFSLRAGNEKGEDEAETYGVCSLRCGHATLLPPNQLNLSFLGKDSMKFDETLTLSNADVYKNIAAFLKSDGHQRKGPDDPIFAAPKARGDAMTPLPPDVVNQFLGRYMKGLSAKVFRTYNASATFQGLLDETESWLAARPTKQEREITPANLRIAYNEANRQVAILCNHQKTVNHAVLNKSLDRTKDKIFGIRYDIYKEQQKLLTFHNVADLKRDYAPKDYDFAKHWNLILQKLDLDVNHIQEHEEHLIEAKKARMVTAFERQESERKYQEEQRKVKKEEETDVKISKIASRADLEAELKKLDAHLKVLERERTSNKSEAHSCNVPSTARRILAKYEAIKKQEAELLNKNNTSDVSLGTSKMNYIDPRITVAWLKKWDAKLEKIAPRKPAKKASDTNNKSKKEEASSAAPDPASSEKMELDLKQMNIGQFFPMALQKKFKWASFDDHGAPLSADWTFVKDARNKMRKLGSAERK